MRLPAISRCGASLLGGALLTCLALGCGHKPAPPAEEEHHAPVKVAHAELVKLGEWTELLGTTQPLPEKVARVSASVAGDVLSVLGEGQGPRAAEGEHVKERQVIVVLDDRLVRANRDKAAAQLDELPELKKQAQYAADLAGIEVKRLEELRRGSTGTTPLASRVELEKARIALKDAQSRQQGLAAKEAAIRAELKTFDTQLLYYTLRAPIAGRLGMLQVVPGQSLTPGTTVAEVIDLEQIDVLCYAPPDAAARLALDQTARLVLPDATAEATPLLGKVAFIAVQAQPETGNVAVKVRFPNPELRLRAHSIVRIYALTKPEQERLTIPEKAIAEDSDVPTVVVVQDVKTEKKGDEEETVGKARKLEVTLGIRDRAREKVEVLGLYDPAAKEKVDPREAVFVTAGGNGLQNDDEVKIEKDAEPEAK